jgi:glycosyltransferase involved in cell wall biosynthesis
MSINLNQLPLEEYDNEIKFIIIIATFNRKNGKTSNYLKRSLSSLLIQKYKNWDLIIVGDKYEPEQQLLEIINQFKNMTRYDNKVIYINNQVVERDTIKDSKILWKCAGATSMNRGLEYARKNGYIYYCHLDDDDYWNGYHLSVLYSVYKKYHTCVFVNTKSTFNSSNKYLPVENMEIFPNNREPIPEGTIHSSFSFKIDIIPFYYQTHPNGIMKPSDAIMLYNIRDFIRQNTNLCSIYASNLTCFHDIEGENK